MQQTNGGPNNSGSQTGQGGIGSDAVVGRLSGMATGDANATADNNTAPDADSRCIIAYKLEITWLV